MRKSLWGVLAVAVALIVSGCATKTFVQEQVAAVSKASDTKIGEVQKQVEATQMDVTNLKKSDIQQNEQLAKLSDTAKEALKRAEEAGKLAKGRFLYEVTLSDETVKFALGKADLAKDAQAALDTLASRIKADGKTKNLYVEVQGHTDSLGSEKYNLKLGQERAEAVMRYLNMQAGIPLSVMNVISYGEYKPVDDNKTAAGRAKNRRVTIVVLE
ncbi:MAG TPA: OmpA family protein [Thermoanaerobaculaceae bacterium]|nr:OmpA family protein [Thermoanaerobaculaceae bacterium]HPS79142.1 OmpA family protein [Thermoanaerobaculaceae bacterium]